MMSPQESIGTRYGRLVVSAISGKDSHGRAIVRCQCDCGTSIERKLYTLRQGFCRSCGCLQRECRLSIKSHGDAAGGSVSAEYASWAAMIQRCTNPSTPNYRNYGARGITVCDEWLDYSNFLRDMGRRPSLDFSIERKNNQGNYEPGNCIWGTRTEQARNRRNNRVLKLGRKSMCVAAWAEKTGLSASTILHRLATGWSERKALTTPRKAIEHTVREMARKERRVA